uniref:BZIP domain-containing protein n=1 Tax=Populus trichocarpa TaxID=3694 RepID=U5FRA9_POPTR|eukprot:XP_006374927.1 ABSCISIC ACID-INSENSITIVE 5-like protein 5 isoform X2 [Populus trichocarpa]
MGTNFNFKSFTNDPSDAGGGRPPGNFPLASQSSIYSLTLEELQNTMGGSLGKDFGSMNMDELLKSIWSAEETQTVATATSAGVQDGVGLQRQGSLTLPRTLSLKTVDEVWKDMSKEYAINGTSAGVANNVPQRQPTLGEITLEEFLVRAGVVREDIPVAAKINTNGGFFGDLSRLANNSSAIGFQQNRGVGLNNNNTNQISLQSSNLPLNGNGFRSNQAQVQQQQQQQIFPKQPNMGYVTQMPPQSSPGIRGGILGIGDQGINSNLMQGGGMGVVGLGVATGSPANQLSSDGIGKSNGDTSSVSPVPYVFSGSGRGRRAGGAVEKVVERRQRRMIKNRESAARSRARKQAYTMELEAEVAKLKAENEELQKKQAEMMEMQKNQVMEMMTLQQGGKRRCLRRTQTGPW